MKNRKRNIALFSVLMCVAAAVLLNWSYKNRWGKADRVMVLFPYMETNPGTG